MIDEFDRRWLEAITPATWIQALYALIGLTRLGERPTTVRRPAATLGCPEEEAVRLAWEAARVRPDGQGRIRLDTPWPGASPRRRLLVGDRELPVSGCAPDLFAVAAVVDVPFRVEDTCPATGAPIRIGFVPGGVESVDPPEAAVVMLPPEQAAMVAELEIEQVNADLCVQQPFFASTRAARGWLDAHPGGRVFPVAEMPRRLFVAHARDTWRPRILAHAA